MIGVKGNHRYVQDNPPLPDLLCTDYILSRGGSLDAKKSTPTNKMSASLSSAYVPALDATANGDHKKLASNRSAELVTGQSGEDGTDYANKEVYEDVACNFKSAKAVFERLERQNLVERGALKRAVEEGNGVLHSRVSRRALVSPLRSRLPASTTDTTDGDSKPKTGGYPVKTVAYLTPKVPFIQNLSGGGSASPPEPSPKPRSCSVVSEPLNDFCTSDFTALQLSRPGGGHDSPSSHMFSAVARYNHIFRERPRLSPSSLDGLRCAGEDSSNVTAVTPTSTTSSHCFSPDGKSFRNDTSIAELTNEFNKVVSQIERTASDRNATSGGNSRLKTPPPPSEACQRPVLKNGGDEVVYAAASATSMYSSSTPSLTSFFSAKQSPTTVRRSFVTSSSSSSTDHVLAVTGRGMLSKNAVSCDQFLDAAFSSLPDSNRSPSFMTASCSLQQLNTYRQQPPQPAKPLRPSCLLPLSDSSTSSYVAGSPSPMTTTTAGGSGSGNTSSVTTPTSSVSAQRTYEPYWRHHAWYSRRYGLDSVSRFPSVSSPTSPSLRAPRLTDTTATDRGDQLEGAMELVSSTSSTDTVTSPTTGKPAVDGQRFDSKSAVNLEESRDQVKSDKNASSLPQSPATTSAFPAEQRVAGPESTVRSAEAMDEGEDRRETEMLSHDADLEPLDRLSISSRDSQGSGSEGSGGMSGDRYSPRGSPDSGSVHMLGGGHFWVEIPGLSAEESLPTDDTSTSDGRKSSKVKFSTEPIRVYSTYSMTEYDRKNDEVDPVAASAEYELERRLERMDIFDVELRKGPQGLGFSIIGMGVGADAGLEKLGIFVKCITPGSAVDVDGRIQVGDQIVEVDGKSLVGISQAYAASVLRNTLGLVKFKIGRERDPANSEITALIMQSLEQEKMPPDECMPRAGDHLPYGSGPMDMPRLGPFYGAADNTEDDEDRLRQNTAAVSGSDWRFSAERGSVSVTSDFLSPEMESPEQFADNGQLNHLMLELRNRGEPDAQPLLDSERTTPEDEKSSSSSPVADSLPACAPTSSAFHQNTEQPPYSSATYPLYDVPPPPPPSSDHLKLAAGQKKASQASSAEFLPGSSSTESIDGVQQKISYLEGELNEVKIQTSQYQELLQNSHGHYVQLERKYVQARMMIKDYQEREKSLAEREEAHLKELREKDHHYSHLVKQLSEKVMELETQLRLAQQKRASMIESSVAKSSESDVSPALAYQPMRSVASPPKGKDIFETAVERVDETKTVSSAFEMPTQPVANDHKTTVVVEPHAEYSASTVAFGVPSTELLDVRAARSKADTVRHSQVMSARHPPSRPADKDNPGACRSGPKNTLNSPRSPDSFRNREPDYGNQKTIKGPSTSGKVENEVPNSPLNVQRLKNMILRKKAQNSDPEIGEFITITSATMDVNAIQWHCEDVCQFLKSLGLEKYTPEFIINRIDGVKLLQLDGAKLKSIGVQNHADRALIKKRVKDMRSQIEKDRKLVEKRSKKVTKTGDAVCARS